MSRPLRDTDPSKVHLITCRSRNAELLFVPRHKTNNIIGGIIAKYAKELGIELYAVAVLSNHYHILLTAPRGNLSLFAENINREIAKRVNWHLDRKGSLWGRRYDDQVVLEVEDALEALVYTLTNAVKHLLVNEPKHWPGVNTYWQSLGRKANVYTFMNYSAYQLAKSKAAAYGEVVRKSDYEEKHALEIKPLPLYEKLPFLEQRKRLEKALNSRTRKLSAERQKAGKSCLGRKAVLEQRVVGSYPKEVSRSQRPTCYTRNYEAKKEYDEEERERRFEYREASLSYRSGNESASFPDYCFYPPRHHVPRSISSHMDDKLALTSVLLWF